MPECAGLDKARAQRESWRAVRDEFRNWILQAA